MRSVIVARTSAIAAPAFFGTFTGLGSSSRSRCSSTHSSAVFPAVLTNRAGGLQHWDHGPRGGFHPRLRARSSAWTIRVAISASVIPDSMTITCKDVVWMCCKSAMFGSS
jgi:hypothetical protein